MMKNKKHRLITVQNEAEKFLKDEGFDSLPIDLMAIAERLEITVQAKPADNRGVSGMLLKYGDTFGIMYATHINNTGFQRFSIAHEIGHFLLDGHIEQILPDGANEHESRAGFTSSDPYEIEADNFASALIMPSELFKKEIRKIEEGLEAIKALADICETSLTSTAIRYTKFAEEPCAIIVSEDNTVDYAFMSESLEQFSDIEWIKKGAAVSKDTLTYNYSDTDEGSDLGNLSDWFEGCSFEIQEDVIKLGEYGKTLTVITVTQDMDEYEEDADLDESLQIRFKR